MTASLFGTKLVTESSSIHRPFALAWSVAFASLVLFERRAARFPAYHDGRIHFDVAGSLHEHLGFPFVAALDTGHPPLVSFLLALAWLVPAPRLLVMHVFIWAAAALFVAAVFEVGRRSFGACGGRGLLFHAAFAWVAILGVATGRPRVVSVPGAPDLRGSHGNGRGPRGCRWAWRSRGPRCRGCQGYRGAHGTSGDATDVGGHRGCRGCRGTGAGPAGARGSHGSEDSSHFERIFLNDIALKFP